MKKRKKKALVAPPDKVYIVECFDERRGGLGGNIGGSVFIANGMAYQTEKAAEKVRAVCKKDGLAASIRTLVLGM